MSTMKFSEEQQQQLRSNKYTARVTASTLSLTKEFKEVFYEKYLSGVLPREILREHGYPVEILGKQRIWGIAHYIKKEYEANGCFGDIRTPKSPEKQMKEVSSEEQLRQLKLQLDYLTQEVEFLKKISSVRTTRK